MKHVTQAIRSVKDRFNPTLVRESVINWHYDAEDMLFRQVAASRTRWEWVTLMDAGLRRRFDDWRQGKLKSV